MFTGKNTDLKIFLHDIELERADENGDDVTLLEQNRTGDMMSAGELDC